VIAAVEGRAHVHSEYALLANVIVAAEGATFQDVAHFAAGVVSFLTNSISFPFIFDLSVPLGSVKPNPCLDARDLAFRRVLRHWPFHKSLESKHVV
jgi:hypothetical protein